MPFGKRIGAKRVTKPPPLSEHDRRAVLTVHRLTGLADAIRHDRDAAHATVQMLDVVMDDARKPELRLTFEQWRRIVNVLDAAWRYIPTRLSVDPAMTDRAWWAVEETLRHRFCNGDWTDTGMRYRRALIERIELLRNAARNVALHRDHLEFEATHADELPPCVLIR